MAFNNNVPYTDFHEMNLDWIIQEMKQLVQDWEDFSGRVSATAHTSLNPEVEITGDLKEGLNFDFGLVQGPRGQTGAIGPQGPQGPQGNGLQILDTYPTLADLQAAHPTGSSGDAYLVGSGGSYTLYIWSTSTSQWTDGGSLTSPAPASAAPSMDGTAAVGSSLLYAREDHVHPSDTSKLDASSSDGIYAVSSGSQTMLNYSDNSYPDAVVRYDSVGDINARYLKASADVIADDAILSGDVRASGNISGDTISITNNTVLNSQMLAAEASSNAYRPMCTINPVDPLALAYDLGDMTPFISFNAVSYDQNGTRATLQPKVKFTESFTVNSTDYAETRVELSPASENTRGGVKVGTGLNVDQDGTLNVAATMTRTLVWENPDITTAFPATNITDIDLSPYVMIIILLKNNANQSTYYTQTMMIPIGYASRVCYIAPDSKPYWRLMTPSSSGLNVYAGYNDGTMDNTVLIPYRIYGIK